MRAVDRVLPILKAGYSLKFLFLPDNQDPDEYLQAHGRESFGALMKKTRPLIDILWQKYTENEDSSTPEKKALIEKTLLAEVAKITDATVRSYYAQEIRNRIYMAFKQTAWQKREYSAPQPRVYAPRPQPMPTAPAPYNPPVQNQEPPAYLGNIPLGEPLPIPQPYEAPAPRPRTPQTPSYSRPNNGYNNNRYNNSRRNNYNSPRPQINHIISNAPETLRQSAEGENDKNIRFMIAAELIYPELIDDYEEQLFSSDIKNPKLKELLTTIADIYHETEEPLSSEELLEKLSSTPQNQQIKELWELDMLQKRPPFINDLRRNIDKLLLEDKLRNLEDEIKNLTNEICQNFTEESYARLSGLKKERDEILSHAAEPDD